MSGQDQRGVSTHYCNEDCPCALAEVERLNAQAVALRAELAARDASVCLCSDRLIAELAASENLVTALQAELAATAQRAVESVREAREEQREADLRALEARFGEEYHQCDVVRATPLDATPLGDRIEWLERERDEYFARHGSSADCDRKRDALKAELKFAYERGARAETVEAELAAMKAERDALKAQVEGLRLAALKDAEAWRVTRAELTAERERNYATSKELTDTVAAFGFEERARHAAESQLKATAGRVERLTAAINAGTDFLSANTGDDDLKRDFAAIVEHEIYKETKP